MNKEELNKKIEKLEDDLAYMDGLFFDLGKWKLNFIEYIDNKIKNDSKNKKIYKDILNECQLLFDII